MTIPLHGVTLSFLHRFIDEMGGKEQLGDYTTEEICESFIKPYTEEKQESFCDMLRRDGTFGYEAKANVFVSHAWLDKFVDVVNALAENYGPDESFWIDIFSVNQHIVTAKDFNWWNSTFKSAIGEIGNTVLVMAPWNDPPLNRAWCIYEIYCTIETKSKFHVAVTNRDKKALLLFSKTRGIECMDFFLFRFHGQYETFDPEDYEKFIEVANKIGFSQFNKVVINAFQGWMMSLIFEQIKEDEKNGDINPFLISLVADFHEAQGNLNLAEERWLECLKLTKNQCGDSLFVSLTALARLSKQYINQGYLDKAKELLTNTLEQLPEGIDDEHPLLPLLQGYCSRESIASTEENHANILFLTGNFAKVYEKLGNFEAAEKLYLSSLERCKLHLGENVEETLSLMNTVANAYLKQTKYDKAETLFLEARDRGNVHLGENNQVSSDADLYLSSLYMLQGNWEKAEPFFIKSYEERRKTLGEDHKDTLKSINSLAVVYHKMGNYQEAERLYSLCATGRSKTLGNDDPETLTSKNILARLYIDQEKYEEAEPLLVEVKDRGYRVFGEDHPVTSAALQNLMWLYQLQGQGEKLVALFLAAIENKKSLLGENHEETMEARYGLAKLYEKMGKDQEAEEMYRQCYERSRASLGENHPDTLKAMNLLGFFYSSAHGLYRKALPLFAECLKQRREVLGSDHEDTITSMFNLAAVYLKLSDSVEEEGNPNIEAWLKSAEHLFLECVDRSRRVLGDDHSNTLEALNIVGNVYERQLRFEEAKSVYEFLIGQRKQALGEDHPLTIQAEENLRSFLDFMNELGEEENHLEEHEEEGDDNEDHA
eukprot:gene7045-7605_t